MDSGFFVRSALGFYLAFLIGWWGLPGILSRFNSTPAGTTAYLMAASGQAGSAIVKNIARFQGTAGGTLIGQLAWTTLVSCALWGGILGTLAVGVTNFFCM